MMSSQKRLSCPICKSYRVNKLKGLNNFVPVKKKTFKIYAYICRCLKCNFHFNSYRNTNYFRKFYNCEPVRDSRIYKHFNFKDYIKLIDTKKKDHILEVGGANNFFQKKYLQGKNIKIFNLEIKSEVNEKIKKNLKFNRVLHIHVLEHVVDLDQHINLIKKMLNDQASIIIEVPNVKIYDKNLFLYNATHINHFSEDNLSFLFGKHGFLLQKHNLKPTRKFGAIFKFKYFKNTKIKINSPNFTKNKLHKVFDKSFELIEKFEKDIVNKVKNHDVNNGKLILWGCSEFLSVLLKKFNANYLNSKIEIIDINKNKKNSLKFKNILVHTPDYLKNIYFQEVLIMTPRLKVVQMVKDNLKKILCSKTKYTINCIGTKKIW